MAIAVEEEWLFPLLLQRSFTAARNKRGAAVEELLRQPQLVAPIAAPVKILPQYEHFYPFPVIMT